MPRLPRIEGRVLVRAMERDGFDVVRVKGSHFILQLDSVTLGHFGPNYMQLIS
jgi:predicted RNA binding protein YcfA (HicA-like mRNA interferase family)